MSQQNNNITNKPLRLVVDIDKPVDENSKNKIGAESFLIVTDWDSDIKSIKHLIQENYRKWYPERKPLSEDFYVQHSITGASIHDESLKMNEIFDDWGKGMFSPRIFVYNSKKRQREESHQENNEDNLETPLKKLKKTNQSKSVDYKTVKPKVVKEKRNSLVVLPKVASNKAEENEDLLPKSGRSRRKKRDKNKGATANKETQEQKVEDSPTKKEEIKEKSNVKVDTNLDNNKNNQDKSKKKDDIKNKESTTQENKEIMQYKSSEEVNDAKVEDSPNESTESKIEKPKLNGVSEKKVEKTTKISKPKANNKVTKTPEKINDVPDIEVKSIPKKSDIIDDDDSSSSDSEDSEKMSDILTLLNSSKKAKKSTNPPKSTPKSSIPLFNTSKDIFSTPIPQFSSKKK